MINGRRVVVTGVGAIGPNGHAAGLNGAPSDRPSLIENLRQGRSCIREVTRFDTSTLPVHIAGEVDWENDDLKAMDKRLRKQVKNMGRNSLLGVTAGLYAMQDAKLKKGDVDAAELGICMGADGQCLPLEDWGKIIEEVLRSQLSIANAIKVVKNGFAEGIVNRIGPGMMSVLEPTWLLRTMPAGPAAHLALACDAQNEVTTISQTCAASTIAIGQAYRTIRDGQATVMLAGGADSRIAPDFMAGFCQLETLSRQNHSPERASRPFDAKRDGFVLGEGAAVMVLENLEHAKQRGAAIYAEIVGSANRGDAFSLTDPAPDGRGAVSAVRHALAEADLQPDQIGWVSCHGSGTVKGDSTETKILKTVFGDSAQRVPVSSTKSMAGHLVTASGAHEVASGLLALASGFLPPTVNYENRDPECDLDWIPNEPRRTTAKHWLKLSFGFGGQNAALVIKTWN